MSLQLLEDTRLFSACQKCYNLKPSIICETSSGECAFRHYATSLFFLSELTDSTNEVVLTQYSAIRPFTNQRTTNLCSSYNPMQWSLCLNGDPCRFAHSKAELKLWTHAEKNRLSWTEVSRSIQGSFTDSGVQPPLFHCQLCNLNFSTVSLFSDHCDSRQHRKLLKSVPSTGWKHRAPPELKSSSKYYMCRHVNTCPNGGSCGDAHSPAELQEWQRRLDFLNRKLEFSKEKKLLSFADQIILEYEKTSSFASVLANEIPGIRLKFLDNKPYGRSCLPGETVQWNIKISCANKKMQLQHVGFLEEATRFSLSRISNRKQGRFSSHVNFSLPTCNDPNLSHGVGGFQVKFTAQRDLGSFHDNLVFEFLDRPRPAFVAKFSVEVVNVKRRAFTDATMEKKPVLWEGTRPIVPFNDQPSANKVQRSLDDLLVKYKPPEVALEHASGSLRDFEVPDLDSKSLTADNYVRRMHEFLYHEETARSRALKKLNSSSRLTMAKTYTSVDGGMNIAEEGKLFARFCPITAMNRDSDEGLLFLEHCNMVLLGLRSNEALPVYQAEIAEKSPEHVWLRLSEQCVEDWELYDGTSTYCDIHLQLERQSFCTAHYALDQLDELDRISLLFPPKQTKPANRSRDSVRKRAEHQRKLQLNEQQMAIFEASVLDSPGQILVVLGPFGTGKTYAIGKCVTHLVETRPDSKILICTHSNSAADLYIQNYFAGPSTNNGIVRIYYHKRNTRTVPREVQDCCLFDEENGGFRYPSTQEIISNEVRVVVTTFNTSIALGLMGTGIHGVFTHIFLDEGSQAMEAEAIIPLTLASSNKTQVIVAGDHLQISQKIYSKKFGSESDYTLVERLFTMQRNFVFLESNYRCVRPILQLTEKIFYRKGLLKSCSDEVVLPGLEPVQFHHVQGSCEQDPSTCGFKNVKEAEKVVEIVEQLLDNYQGVIHEEDISVVSSYAIQVATIRSLLRQSRNRRVAVHRVRNVQGQEYKIIVMSCVHRRAGIEDKIGSSFGLLSNVGLLNTAITRSKIAVIAVGDAATLCSIGECQHRWNVFLMNCAILPRDLSLASIREEVASISTLNPNAAGFQLRRANSRSSGLAAKRVQTQRNDESSDDEDNIYGAYEDTSDSETDSEEFIVNDKILNEIFASQSGERTDKLDEKEIEQPAFSGDLRHLLKTSPDTHKHCVVDMKAWDLADAIPVKRESGVNKIILNSRKNIGRVFDGDEVVVEIVKRVAPNGPVYGKVLGVLESNPESVKDRNFVCIPEMPFQKHVITVMCPIDRKSPKLAILKPRDIGPYQIGVYRMNKTSDQKEQQPPIKCFKRVTVDKYSYTRANGNLFVVTFLRWNEDGYFPFGYVSRVFSASNALECISIKCQIPPKHKKALEESSKNLKDENIDHRIDMTKLFVFTIDPPGAKDLDDGFSVEKCSQPGHTNCYKIGVHICDVASVVAKFSHVDKEAEKRVRSYYDSDGKRKSSMLPESVSRQCSLREMETRRAVSTFFHTSQQYPDVFSESGRFPNPQLTTVRSKKQLSYTEAQQLLHKAFGASGQGKIFQKSDEGTLHLQIYELWKFFMAMRTKRLDIATYGVEHKDESLEQFREEGAARLLVEEAMTTVNACSALYLSRKCSDFTLRCQEKPNLEQAESWSSGFAEGIRLSVNLQSWQKYMNLMNQPQQTPADPITILDSVWGHIDEALKSGDFISALMLFCCDNLQPAISPAANNFNSIQHRAVDRHSDVMWQDVPLEEHSHFRLRLPYYATCTSPMRRYLDLHMQRQFVKYCRIAPWLDEAVVPLNPLPENEPLKKFCDAELASDKKQVEFQASMSSYRFATSMGRQENRNYQNVIVTQVTSKEITVKLPGVQCCQEYTIPYSALHTQISKWLANKEVPLGPRGEKYLLFNDVKWFKRYYDLSKDKCSPQVIETGGKMQKHAVDRKRFLELTDFLKANLPKKTITDLKPHIVGQLKAISTSKHTVTGCDLAKGGQGPCDNYTCFKRDSQCPDHMAFWTKNKIKHCRVVSMQFKAGASLHIQLFARTQQMLLAPSIQLLCLADNFDLCLMHQQFAVETFASDVRPAHVPPEYRSVEEYVEKWLPVLRLDGVYSAVRDSTSITYDKVDIFWDPQDSSGHFYMDSWFLKERFAYIEKDDFLCIRYCNVKSDVTGNLYTWMAHALITHVKRDGDSRNDNVHFRLCKTAVGSKEPDVTQVLGKKATVEHILYQMPHRWMATCLNQVTGISSSSIVAMLCCDTVRRQDRYVNLDPVNFAQRQFVERLEPQVLPGFSNSLNEGQMEQVKQALVNRLTLIQGPPGTGKSFLGAHLVYFFNFMKQLSNKSKKKKKIMYCGPSNKCVDVVAGYLIASGLSVLRVYSKTMEELAYPNILKPKIGTEMREGPPDNLKGIALHEKIRTSGSHARQIVEYEARFDAEKYVTYSEYIVYLDLVQKAKEEEISRYDIIICTCTTAAVVKKMASFSHCIVDEAGMCSEPETLVPVVMSDADQVVLIGDHMQLQPVIQCRRASTLGLGTSMFERLKDNAGMLTTQYRMSKEICKFPSETFYEGKLRADPSVAKREQRCPGVMQVNGNRAFFVHLEGEEKNSFSKHEHGGENSKYNENEAKTVVTILRWLHEKNQVDLGDVMILTPYNAQVFEIKKLLDEKHQELRKVHVGSVVTSQGSERDYVIFSTVRSQPPEIIEPSPSRSWRYKNLGFVTNPHQINVAITRAKKGLCIIGNRHLLSCDPDTWKKLLDSYNRRGAIVPFDMPNAPWEITQIKKKKNTNHKNDVLPAK